MLVGRAPGGQVSRPGFTSVSLSADTRHQLLQLQNALRHSGCSYASCSADSIIRDLVKAELARGVHETAGRSIDIPAERSPA